jgi:hypothetical protein
VKKDHQGQLEDFNLAFSKPIDYTLGAHVPPAAYRAPPSVARLPVLAEGVLTHAMTCSELSPVTMGMFAFSNRPWPRDAKPVATIGPPKVDLRHPPAWRCVAYAQ